MTRADAWVPTPDGEDEEPEALLAPIEDDEPAYAFTAGGGFILDAPETPEALWGKDGEVLMADGESLMIAGGQGLGKSTLAGQLALGRAGFADFRWLLGYPIQPGRQRVLYLAMDRPPQIARSLRRMVSEGMRADLDDHLVVWKGPPPGDLAKHRGLLLDLCRKAWADTVIVDSMKDAAICLTDDEVGARYNQARATATEAGVQVVDLHHNRKILAGAKAAHPTLDDVYGSTWLTAGAGSVLLLSGAAGDPIVALHQVKQPAEPVGPLRILHDHKAGRSSVWHSVDLLTVARACPKGLTAKSAACALFDTTKPTPPEVEKARRRLEALTPDRLMKTDGDPSTNTATAYFPADELPLRGIA